MFLGLLTTAIYNQIYKKKTIESECVAEIAKKTSNEFNILETAKNDFIKNDSNSIDIRMSIPNVIRENRT